MNTQQEKNLDSYSPPRISKITKSQSAFTPVVKKPIPQRVSPLNFKDSSPLQQLILLNLLQMSHENLRKNQQNSMLSLISPMKLDFSQAETQTDTNSEGNQTSLQQSKSDFGMDFTQKREKIVAQIKPFNLDFIIPPNLSQNLTYLPGKDQQILSAVPGVQSPTNLSDKDTQSSSGQSLSENGQDKEQTECSTIKKTSLLSASLEKFFLNSEENLNHCVDGLFCKDKSEPQRKIKSIIRYSETSQCQSPEELDEEKDQTKRRRQRKNLNQHNILMEEFEKNPHWDKKQIQKLSDLLGLKESQIYKWNWDHRKKMSSEIQVSTQ